MNKEQYTFTFEYDQEKQFRRIVDRLDPDEFTVSEDIHITDPENPRYSQRQTVMEMEPEAASMFRLGMKNVKIRRTRTEEELAAEEAEAAKNRITINVVMPGNGTATP
jgi:hypothetical protein